MLKDPVFLSTPIKVSEEVYLGLTEEKKPERFPNIHAKPGTPEYEGQYDDDMMQTQYADDSRYGGSPSQHPGGGPNAAWADESPQGSPGGMNRSRSRGGDATIKAPQPSENVGIRLNNRPSKTQLGGNFPSQAYPRSASPPAQGDAPPVNEGYMSSLQKALSLANHLQGTNYSELDPLQGLDGVDTGGMQGSGGGMQSPMGGGGDGGGRKSQSRGKSRGKSSEGKRGGGTNSMKERRQETDDVIGQLTSLNQDLYGGGRGEIL